MRRAETDPKLPKWEPNPRLWPQLTKAIEQRPNPPCLLYSGLERRQGGMTSSEVAQSLRGTRNLDRLRADAGLFQLRKSRTREWVSVAPSSGCLFQGCQTAPHPEMRAAAQTAAVSPVVWLTDCDFLLSAVALRKNSNLLCPERSGVSVAGALNYRHARLLDLRASANLL